MADTIIRPRYEIYNYTSYLTFVPRAGEIMYFTNVESYVNNIISVIGDGINQVQYLPFIEIINIETSISISLNTLRISGNKVIIQNISASPKFIDLGTPGSPNYYELQPNILIMLKFNGTEWVLLTDAIKSIFIDDDYTIQNTDYIYYYKVNTNSKREVTITIPLRADNGSKEPFYIQNIGTGIVRIVRQVSDTINGLTELRLYSENNYVEIYPKPFEWGIRNQFITLDSGRINTNDWTLRSLGLSTVGYDNVTEGTPVIGDIITGGTSGTTGKIVSYDGTTLYLIEVTNGGIFTNNETISGITIDTVTFTALVNEPTGNNKNKDTNIFIQQMALKSYQIQKQFFIYFSDDDNNYVQPSEIAIALLGSSDNYGNGYFFIDNDNITMRTANTGYAFIGFSGTRTILTTEDYYYRHYFKINY